MALQGNQEAPSGHWWEERSRMGGPWPPPCYSRMPLTLEKANRSACSDVSGLQLEKDNNSEKKNKRWKPSVNHPWQKVGEVFQLENEQVPVVMIQGNQVGAGVCLGHFLVKSEVWTGRSFLLLKPGRTSNLFPYCWDGSTLPEFILGVHCGPHNLSEARR